MQIDYSYITYPENSRGRVLGRRRQAYELASASLGKKIENINQVELAHFYVLVVIGEVDRLSCNNWRKLHGLPMKRRIRSAGCSWK